MSNASLRYRKTDAGHQALKARSPQLTPRQRPLLILFDGIRTVEQVFAATSGLGVSPSDVDHLVACGFLTPAQESAAAVQDHAPAQAQPKAYADPPGAPDAPDFSVRSQPERYAQAYPIAVRLTSALGLRGFKLNLAVERAQGYEDMAALLPKIQEAVGEAAYRELEQAMKG